MNIDIEERLKEIIGHGLVRGLGNPIPGGMCVEAAICLALGEDHSAEPSCVAEPDRLLAIRLSNARWSSPQACAEALLPLALAQLGTAGTDRTAWARALVEGTIRRVVPVALRAAAFGHPNEKHRKALEAAAKRCEQEGSIVVDYAANAAADRATYAATTARDAADLADVARAVAYVTVAVFAAADAEYADARDDILRLAVQVALDAYAAAPHATKEKP
ncbi:MAG: hypothetical protein EB084_22575 [Proteobacteria bacterium]|nr:hypothetical protein [Pseudomonadota bacterium]